MCLYGCERCTAAAVAADVSCHCIASATQGGGQIVEGEDIHALQDDLKIDGAAVFVQFGLGDDKTIEELSCATVRALANREVREPRKATGRLGGETSNIAALVGLQSAGQQNNSAGHGRGRGSSKAFGKTVRSGSAPPAGRGLPAARGNEPEQPVLQAGQLQPTSLAQLGAEYADSDEDEAAGTQPAKKPKVGVRSLDAEGLAEYKHSMYEAKKAKAQDDWAVSYGKGGDGRDWLVKDNVRGWHCKYCIDSKVTAADKLSTTGYGYAKGADDESKLFGRLDCHKAREQGGSC